MHIEKKKLCPDQKQHHLETDNVASPSGHGRQIAEEPVGIGGVVLHMYGRTRRRSEQNSKLLSKSANLMRIDRSIDNEPHTRPYSRVKHIYQLQSSEVGATLANIGQLLSLSLAARWRELSPPACGQIRDVIRRKGESRERKFSGCNGEATTPNRPLDVRRARPPQNVSLTMPSECLVATGSWLSARESRLSDP